MQQPAPLGPRQSYGWELSANQTVPFLQDRWMATEGLSSSMQGVRQWLHHLAHLQWVLCVKKSDCVRVRWNSLKGYSGLQCPGKFIVVYQFVTEATVMHKRVRADFKFCLKHQHYFIPPLQYFTIHTIYLTIPQQHLYPQQSCFTLPQAAHSSLV